MASFRPLLTVPLTRSTILSAIFLLPLANISVIFGAMDIQQLTTSFLKASGWSQRNLAEAIGVHKGSLSRYLHHRIRPSIGEKLAEFLLSQSSTPVSFDAEKKA